MGLNTEDFNLQVGNLSEIKYDKIHYYFTSEDILGVIAAYRAGHTTIESMVQYFNSRYECNKILAIINEVIEKGISIKPDIAFVPYTEKSIVTNGKFRLTNKPYNLGGSLFLNNLIVLKRDDGTYEFFDDGHLDPDTLIYTIDGNGVPENDIVGTATVSYFISTLNDEPIF